MNRFSILLIENKIHTGARIAQVISKCLSSYNLYVINEYDDAVANPEPANLILLNTRLLQKEVSDQFSSLATVYPQVPIILIHKAPEGEAAEDERLLKALAAGGNDYISLSQAGLTVLGKRIIALHKDWQEQHKGEDQTGLLSLYQILGQALIDDKLGLAVQLIGPDDRIRAWNRGAEKLFGVEQEQAIGSPVDKLPLSARNLSRLKDIIDQARVTGRPFCIPTYPLEDLQKKSRWGQVHVYPISRDQVTGPEKQGPDICIISANVTDLRQSELDQWYYNQELQTLLEISRKLSEQLDLNSTLEKIGSHIKSLLNSDSCYIFFLDKDNQTLRPALSIGPNTEQVKKIRLTAGKGAIGSVLSAGKVAQINPANGQPHPLYGGQPFAPPLLPEKHLLCAPLTALKGAIGLVIAGRSQNLAFTADDLRFFQNLVQLASSAISNARLFEETERNLNELAIFYEASSAIATTWDTQEVLTTLIRQMVQGMAISYGHIASWDKSQQKGIVQATFSADAASFAEVVKVGQTVDFTDRPALSTVITQQRPVFFQLNNPSLDQAERDHMEAYGCFSRLLVPLVVKGETIGWAELWETRQERFFTSDEVRLVRMLANQAAVTLENARYLKQTQQTLVETTALYQVASALAATQDSSTIMRTVLEEYLQVLDLKQGTIIIFDFEAKAGIVKVSIQDEEVVHSLDETTPQMTEGYQIPLSNNLLYQRLMSTHQPVFLEETQAAWLTPSSSQPGSDSGQIGGGWGSAGALSMLVIPIQMRGEIVGAIVVEATRQRRIFDRWATSLGQAMADQLGIALQNVQLYELEYQRRQQAETLREVSFIVGSSLNLDEVLERILDQLGRVVKYDSAAIHLIEGKHRRIIAGRGFSHPEEVIGLTFPIQRDDNEPGSIAIHTRQPLVIGNISQLYEVFKEEPHSHIKSWMGIPLIARDKVIGLISIDRTEPNVYTEADVNLASAFANQVAITLENARLYELEVRQLERELEIAQGIQKTLLPQVVPKVPGLEICGRILPAQQIGGDFFHFFFLGQDQFGVAIGDVSGKGIPAALYMAAAMTAIDAQINDNLGPGELLNKLQRILYNRLQENKMNVGLQVATFTVPPSMNQGKNSDKPTGRMMTLASAGMIAPIIATKQGNYLLPVSGLPIGAPLSELTYNESELSLEPATAIIFTSDGIVEARNEAGELFGFERLETTINQIIDRQQADIIAEYIIETAQDFTGQAEQSDDMTVVVVIVKT